MPSSRLQVDPHTGKRYYLITNVATKTDGEVDLHADSWELPYHIDDADLTFDGKPLNMLYEENRYHAEHVTGSCDHYSGKEMSHVSLPPRHGDPPRGTIADVE
jgi:hypothetical protein